MKSKINFLSCFFCLMVIMNLKKSVDGVDTRIEVRSLDKRKLENPVSINEHRY